MQTAWQDCSKEKVKGKIQHAGKWERFSLIHHYISRLFLLLCHNVTYRIKLLVKCLIYLLCPVFSSLTALMAFRNDTIVLLHTFTICISTHMINQEELRSVQLELKVCLREVSESYMMEHKLQETYGKS